MNGFNWVDIVILLLFASAVYFGTRLGFFRLLFAFGGFFAALFLSGWILPHILPIHNHTLLSIINGNLVVLAAGFVAVKGYGYGNRLHLSLGHSGKYKGRYKLESVAGISLSLSSAVLAVWLLGAGIGALPLVGLSNTVNESYFIRLFDRHFPAAPTVFEGLTASFNPNAAAQVYAKASPDTSIGTAPLPPATQAVKRSGTSVVHIEGFGCGGIVDGSGFVVAPGLVATNAHVIAGVRRPIIKHDGESFSSEPVLFDPNLDFAVLKVPGLQTAPLSMDNSDLPDNTYAYIISFPKSIFTVTPGRITESLPVQGNNIYGLGSVKRNIYVLNVTTNHGSSGGPVVLPDGKVGGMVFAMSTTNSSYAYALVAGDFAHDISIAKHAGAGIGTGACYAGE